MRKKTFTPCLESLGSRINPSGSGATLAVFSGIDVLQGSNFGDSIRIVPVSPSVVEIDVTNSQGVDTFLVGSHDVLEVLGGSGTNGVFSLTSNTLLVIGGAGDNTVHGGSGFTFEVSTGNGVNNFFAGTTYTTFVAGSLGSTHCFGGGIFNSASLCNGTNTFDANAQQSDVYTFGVSLNTINADATDTLNVFSYNPNDVVNNPFGNPNVHKS